MTTLQGIIRLFAAKSMTDDGQFYAVESEPCANAVYAQRAQNIKQTQRQEGTPPIESYCPQYSHFESSNRIGDIASIRCQTYS